MNLILSLQVRKEILLLIKRIEMIIIRFCRQELHMSLIGKEND